NSGISMKNTSSASRPASVQQRRMPYLQMTSTEAAAAVSSPELLSGILPELFEYEGRPRSWSSRSESGIGQKTQEQPTSDASLERSSNDRPDDRSLRASSPAGGRPRNATTSSLRAPSIRSNGRNGFVVADGLFEGFSSHSQPQVATAFSKGANVVEARGHISSKQSLQHKQQQQQSRPTSSSGVATSGNKQALGMLRPLASKSSQEGMHSSAANIAAPDCTAASALVDTVQQNHTGSTRVVDSSSRSVMSVGSGSVRRRSLVSKPVVEAASVPATTNITSSDRDDDNSYSNVPNNVDLTSVELPSQTTSIWSKLAHMTLRNPSGRASPASQNNPPKKAVDCLREIEASQPPVSEPLLTSENVAICDAPDELNDDTNVSTQAAEVDQPHFQDDNHTADNIMDQNIAADTESNNSTPRSGWLWGWLGSKHQANVNSAANDTAVVAETADPSDTGIGTSDNNATQNSNVLPSLAATNDKVLSKTPTSKASQTLSETDTAVSQGHNPTQQTSMLLPDLDIGDRVSDAVDTDTGLSDCADSIRTTASDLIENNDKSRDKRALKANGEPLYKRLRTMGSSMFDLAIDMAPDWARRVVRGQIGADMLGQRHSSNNSDRTQITSEQIRQSMDEGAQRLGNIAVIGVHGWFPIRMLQMIAGEPTGKSEKFCLMMRDALKSYLREQHGVDVDDSRITLFPLVGEGRIEDRVEMLLSQIVGNSSPDKGSQGANADTVSRSDSRATSDIVSSSSPTVAAEKTAKSKAKSKGKDKADSVKESGVADSTGNPAGKQSAMIAEALMPEHSKRVEKLKEADTVFVVTHSQGTPVSAMLLERLMELEIIDTHRQRVGMLAMAGISHGPFPYLKDNVVIRYIESEAARELFELMDPSSYQSQRYVAALSTILHKGVRLICTGSWVDEVVPLYSAIIQGVSHPNVYRAVYIDAPHYQDDFLTSLIVFALRLRNMDIYDHDLLMHLSEVVAGSLWGHSGHSTVYGEPAVYKLSIKWLLYSTASTSVSTSTSTSVPTAPADIPTNSPASVSGSQIHMSYRPFNAGEKLNPFFIPWIMRTLWDEPEIRQNDSLRIELRRLAKLFDKWMPETKAGKELKYRLEPVRAAL
ncbi:hypothetical protein GGI05_000128, partial [Coemansia sp. RSA 2603]